MHDAQGIVTVANALCNDAEGEDIHDLVEVFTVSDHFSVDAVKMFRATDDIGIDFGVGEFFDEEFAGFGKPCFAFPAFHFDARGDVFIDIRAEEMEGMVFEFPFPTRNTEAVGERRVDIEGFSGDAFNFIFREVFDGAHVVEAVGEFNEQDADVGGDGNKHFTEVGGLFFFLSSSAGGEAEGSDFSHTFDDAGDVGAELLIDLFSGEGGIFEYIVKETGCDGGGIEMELREDLGDLDTVHDIRFAGEPGLSGMRFIGYAIGMADQVQISSGDIFFYLFK